TMDAKLRLMRAVALPPLLPPGPFVDAVRIDDQDVGRHAAEASLHELERGVPKELRDGIDVELGRPADAICRAAKAYDADLVVIGAHPHGALRRALGTTAAKVVRQIDRPLFVARRAPV